jgi:hypothetical protein
MTTTPTAPDPQVRYITATDHIASSVTAAIIKAKADKPELDAAYKKLPEEARLQVGLARKWKVWAVLAPDWWAAENSRRTEAP